MGWFLTVTLRLLCYWKPTFISQKVLFLFGNLSSSPATASPPPSREQTQHQRVLGGWRGFGKEDGGVPGANADHETSALQFPGVKPAHPIRTHRLCESSRLSVISSQAGFAKACEPLCSLQKTKTAQTQGLLVHLFLSAFPHRVAITSRVLTDCWGAWGPDEVAHCLSSKSCNCLFFLLIRCLWRQLRP